VNINGGRARLSPRSYFIPDVVVIPAAYKTPFEDDPRAFNAFAEPLPLVVEVWSSSTGDYDVATKLQGYRERGDAEIWFIDPHERTLTAWRRQPDGSYAGETYRGGVVPVASLPGVVIDFDALLDGSAGATQSSTRFRHASVLIVHDAVRQLRAMGWHILCWQRSRDTKSHE
jgi:Uma2 family endonuclease